MRYPTRILKHLEIAHINYLGAEALQLQIYSKTIIQYNTHPHFQDAVLVKWKQHKGEKAILPILRSTSEVSVKYHWSISEVSVEYS